MELILVIAIIGVLAAFLIPALNSAREKGRATLCRNNLRQLGTAVQLYTPDHDEALPGSHRSTSVNAESDWIWEGPKAGAVVGDGVYIDDKNTAEWKRPGFAFHAEGGSLFEYVTGETRREAKPGPDAYSIHEERTWNVYRCPGTGQLGEALRNNYQMNMYTDAGRDDKEGHVRAVSVYNPASKLLFLNPSPRRTTSGAFDPRVGDYAEVADEMFMLHGGRSEVVFLDNHSESIHPKTIFRASKDRYSEEQYFRFSRP